MRSIVGTSFDVAADYIIVHDVIRSIQKDGRRGLGLGCVLVGGVERDRVHYSRQPDETHQKVPLRQAAPDNHAASRKVDARVVVSPKWAAATSARGLPRPVESRAASIPGLAANYELSENFCEARNGHFPTTYPYKPTYTLYTHEE